MTSPTPDYINSDADADPDVVDLAEIESAPPEQQWRSMLPAAIVGTAVLLVWRFLGVRMFEDHKDIPDSVRIVLALLLATLIAVYPIWIVRRHGQRIFERRFSLLDLLLEGTIAFGVLIGVMGVNLMIGMLWQVVSGKPAGMPEQFEELVFSHDPMTLVLLGLMACIWAPISEELFFRRMLLRALQGRMQLGGAILLQAVLFTVMHDYTGIHVAAIFMLGLALGGLYAWRGTIVSSMMLHAMQNTGATIIFALLMWGSARAPVLGIMMENADDDTPGVQVVRVLPGSGAEAAGLQKGDVITHIRLGGILDGTMPDEPVQDTVTLRIMLMFQRPGDEVRLTVLRNGETLDVPVTLLERNDTQPVEDDGE